MSKQKLDGVWQIMRANRFEFQMNNSDLYCTICENILINAHNGPCGCRFCVECITKYLNGETKICPGNTVNCKNALLNINTNILLDQPLNVQISNVTVKCPASNCEFKDELRNIGDHMKTCSYLSIDCPYLKMGCNESNRNVTNLKNHLITEIVSHTEMLFQMIGNLKNEIQLLKKDKEEMEQKCFENSQTLKKEIEKNTNILNQTVTKVDETKQTINDLKSTGKGNYNKSNMFMISIVVLIVVISIKLIWDKMKALEEVQEQQNNGEFLWRINGWIEKTRQAKGKLYPDILSNAFYSHRNGYKIYLSVYPNGYGDDKGTHLSVFFHLLQGNFDDILPWPFKHDVTFELINQHTGEIHTTATLTPHLYSDENQKPFQKPTSASNIGFGFPKFISLEKLLNDQSLIGNDQIFIRCRVKIE